MASQLRNPLIAIISTIIIAIIVIYSAGIFSVTPTTEGLTIASLTLENDTIKMGTNTTLTVEIENTAEQTLSFELHLEYTNKDFKFYDQLTGDRLEDITIIDPANYTITHPTKGALDRKTTIPILVNGPTPKGSSETFSIWVKVYLIEGNALTLSDVELILLTVTYS